MADVVAMPAKPNQRSGRYEVKVGGTWYAAWRRGVRPRIGGEHRSPYRGFGRITAVREVRGNGSVIRTWKLVDGAVVQT